MKSGLYSPGSNDPTIALVIGEYMAGVQGVRPTLGNIKKSASVGAELWDMAGVGQLRDKGNNWWISATEASRMSDEMAYECDPGLGSPPLTDCAQIEWSQLNPGSLKPPSETVTVGPGASKFFHSST